MIKKIWPDIVIAVMAIVPLVIEVNVYLYSALLVILAGYNVYTKAILPSE